VETEVLIELQRPKERGSGVREGRSRTGRGTRRTGGLRWLSTLRESGGKRVRVGRWGRGWREARAIKL